LRYSGIPSAEEEIQARRQYRGSIALLILTCFLLFQPIRSGEASQSVEGFSPLAVPETAYAVPDPYNTDRFENTRIVVPLTWRDVRVEIYGEDAAFLGSLHGEELKPSEYLWLWNGRDDEGRVLPPGVYYIRVLYRIGEKEERCVFPLRLLRTARS
jgi:hypothetical protein